jgi:hypothetical protein
MKTAISQASLVRGADGRLFAVTGHGITEVEEKGASPARGSVRAGDRVGFDSTDVEAGRMLVTPGL